MESIANTSDPFINVSIPAVIKEKKKRKPKETNNASNNSSANATPSAKQEVTNTKGKRARSNKQRLSGIISLHSY